MKIHVTARDGDWDEEIEAVLVKDAKPIVRQMAKDNKEITLITQVDEDGYGVRDLYRKP